MSIRGSILSTPARKALRLPRILPDHRAVPMPDAVALAGTPGTFSLRGGIRAGDHLCGTGAHDVVVGKLMAAIELVGYVPNRLAHVRVEPDALRPEIGRSDQSEAAAPEAM